MPSINIHLEHLQPPEQGRAYTRNLGWAMALAGVILAAELVGSHVTGSLALLSDAGHVLTDLSGLMIALFAVRLAARPATPQASYGYLRAEVLAALINGVLLVAVVGIILWRAVDRLRNPLPELDALTVLMIASVGLAANLVSARLLHAGAQHNINMRGAYLDVLGDAVASVGVMASAVAVHFTGDPVWDTLVSFLVAGIILWSAGQLLHSTLGILLEGVPAHIDLDDVKRQVEGVSGVVNVHDLHVWTLTPGRHSATLHVSIQRERIPTFHHVIRDIEGVLEERYGLRHCTIQVEPEGEDHVSDRYDPVHHKLPET